jgi:hypothetical protein
VVAHAGACGAHAVARLHAGADVVLLGTCRQPQCWASDTREYASIGLE